MTDTQTIIPAQPNWYVVDLCRGATERDLLKDQYSKCPVVAWQIFTGEGRGDVETYPIGVEGPFMNKTYYLLAPDGRVHEPCEGEWDSVEEWAAALHAIIRAVRHAEAKRATVAA